MRRAPGVSLECCVGNSQGLQRAIDAGAHAAWFLLSADEEFSRRNIGRSIDDSLAELARMRELAESAGIGLGTYLIAAWGGPVGVARGPADLGAVATRLVQMGVERWILADSCGYAAPPQIAELLAFAATLTPLENVSLQIHDSRGMGLASIAALAGMRLASIDTALCGAGGHPASPQAAVGGVCTEDAVQMLELMGVPTGLDLDALVDTANWLDGVLGGREKGYTRRVGKVPQSRADVAAALASRGEFAWPGA